MGTYILIAVLVLIFVLSVFCVIHGVKNWKISKGMPVEHTKMRTGFSIVSALQIGSGSIILICYLLVALLFLNGGK